MSSVEGKPESDPFSNQMPDVEELAENSARIAAEVSKAATAYVKGLESGAVKPAPSESADMLKTFSAVAESWLAHPERTVEVQKQIASDVMGLWAHTFKVMQGEKPEPANSAARDNRFADPDWEKNPYFHLIKHAYLLGSNWAQNLVDKAEGIDEATKRRAAFYVKQLQAAFAPSNYLLTNPELIKQTIEEKGANLARGMQMLAEDMEKGGGSLRIRQVDDRGFEVGKNMAVTPGKVVFRNELMELIQYAPATETVFKRPLLIVPPWINKFYILDLNPEKSFIKWCVDQGLTVFVVSWVNPDERHRACGFAEYMKLGPVAALDVIEEITGEKDVQAIGYCVGGTLLAVTLAWLAAKGMGARINRATFFTTQVDFTYGGDLLAFVSEDSIKALDEKMAETGYLSGASMANAFNMLRPQDLIWSYVVNNYMKGKQPMPFDLLYWNGDSTRMPAANHTFYLRNCYLENNLSKGKMVVDGVKLTLKKVKTPIYNLAAKEDHIAPAKSAFVGSQFFGGPVKYVMAGSGHIAGVVNPATKPKYQYWTGDEPKGAFEDWVKTAKENPGSWWPDWLAWCTKGDKQVRARKPGSRKHKPLCDAPGTYVKVRV